MVRKNKALLSSNQILSLLLIIVTAVLITVAGFRYKQDFFPILPLYISLFVGMMTAHANRYGKLIGGLNCLLYTVVNITYGLYGAAAESLLVSCPMQLIAFFRWNRNAYKHSTTFRRMRMKQRILTGVALLLSVPIVFFMLSSAGSSYRLLDSITTPVSILTSILAIFSYVEFSWLMLITGFLSPVLDIVMMPEHPERITYLIYAIYSLICIVRQFFTVRKLYAEQAKGVSQ